CQQRRGTAEDQGGADPLQKPAKEQRAEARRSGAAEEGRAIPQQTGAKNTGVPENVADPPEGEHQAGVGQDVTDDHPLDLLDRQTKACGDVGERDVDRAVERDDRRAEADQSNSSEVAPRHPGCSVRRRGLPVILRFTRPHHRRCDIYLDSGSIVRLMRTCRCCDLWLSAYADLLHLQRVCSGNSPKSCEARMRPDRRLGNGRPRTDSGGFTPVTPTMGAFLAWATPHQTSRPASHTVS